MERYTQVRAISRIEAADRLDICVRTLDSWRKRGVLRSVTVEGRVLIPEDEVVRILLDEPPVEVLDTGSLSQLTGDRLTYSEAFAQCLGTCQRR
jgi:hypothetical protein